MKKLFIVTSNPTTVEQDKVFQSWIEPRFGWWHWMNQTWMLIDTTGTHTASEIRDQCVECFPGIYVIVFEITGANTWAGFGANSPTDENNNMFTWIKEHWKIS